MEVAHFPVVKSVVNVLKYIDLIVQDELLVSATVLEAISPLAHREGFHEGRGDVRARPHQAINTKPKTNNEQQHQRPAPLMDISSGAAGDCRLLGKASSLLVPEEECILKDIIST